MGGKIQIVEFNSVQFRSIPFNSVQFRSTPLGFVKNRISIGKPLQNDDFPVEFLIFHLIVREANANFNMESHANPKENYGMGMVSDSKSQRLIFQRCPCFFPLFFIENHKKHKKHIFRVIFNKKKHKKC